MKSLQIRWMGVDMHKILSTFMTACYACRCKSLDAEFMDQEPTWGHYYNKHFLQQKSKLNSRSWSSGNKKKKKLTEPNIHPYGSTLNKKAHWISLHMEIMLMQYLAVSDTSMESCHERVENACIMVCWQPIFICMHTGGLDSLELIRVEPAQTFNN